MRIAPLTADVTVGLTDGDLHTVVDDYQACQDVAAAAHQMEYHAILAPAATGLGETLAVFRGRLDAQELPVVTTQVTWAHGPAGSPTRPPVSPSPQESSVPAAHHLAPASAAAAVEPADPIGSHRLTGQQIVRSWVSTSRD